MQRKYLADDGVELPPLIEIVAGDDGGWNGGVAPVVHGDPERQRSVAAYVDTADLRLSAAGLSLERRTGGDDAGWHLALRGGDARSEVRLPIAPGAPTIPDSLQRMVRAQTMGDPLLPVVETVTDRTVRRWVDVTGHVVLKVTDERVTAHWLQSPAGREDAASATESWREIEFEYDDACLERMRAVDARLRGYGLSDAPGATTLARVLDRQRSASSGASEDRELTVESPPGDVLLAHIRAQVRQIRAQDLPVRLDAPDAVHKMRVAARRLRSAFATFKPLLPADVTRQLGGELKWLAGELGAARDAEVMRDRVRTAVEAGGPLVEGDPAAAIVDAELGDVYRAAHDRVLAELDSERYHALLSALDDLVAALTPPERTVARAETTLPRLVARSYTQVRRLVEKADETPEGAEREELLHDVRKAAKRARYAAESVSRIFGADATAFAKAMESLQEALGEHQDSVLARERLRGLARQTSSTDAAFLYGRLHALEELRVGDSERRFRAAWKAAERKALHRWLRRSQQSSGEPHRLPAPGSVRQSVIPRQHSADERAIPGG